MAYFDSVRTRPASVAALQSDSIIVVNGRPAWGDTSTVLISRVGFDSKGKRAAMLCGQFTQPPGGCRQMLTVFLDWRSGSWMVTSYSVR